MSFLTNPWPIAGSSNYVTETQDVVDEIDAGLANHESRITAVEGGGGGGGGSMDDFTVAGDSGTPQTIADGNTLTIAGGTGIDSVASATDTVTLNIDSTVATLTGSQTLANKTLTSPVISTISNTGTLTLPTSTDTLIGKATTDTLTNKTLTSPTLTTPVLGTPSSGTLSNCSGLPVSGITASTSTALGVGSIELGHASDTTIARVSAGRISVEGVNVPTISSTDTFTNKTLTSPTLTTPVLGTPSSGTLSNCSGLPVSGITASTSTALGVGSVELGHASDTTIARVSAGVASVEGVNIVTVSSTDTLTNKTLTTPTIGSMANANHNHTNGAGGGQLTDAALSSAVSVAKGGTGSTTAAAARTALGFPVAGASLTPFMTSQVIYSTGMLMEGSSVTQTLTANQIYAIWFPWVVESGVSFDQVSIYVASAAAAGKIARVMAFAPDGTGGKPSTQLKDYGTVAVDSTGIKTISSTLTPTNNGAGFWLAVVSDGAPQLYAKGNDAMQPMGTNSVAGTTNRGWEYALGSTTAPSPFSASATILTAAYAPLVYLRRT